jgi:hypothetical protein
MADSKSPPSTPVDTATDLGPRTDPNPGERSMASERANVPLDSLGIIPARGNRAGGGRQIDVGAQVGILRNFEFTAGGRSHRISKGSFSNRRPALDPKSGQVHIPAAIDSIDEGVGSKSPSGTEQPMPELVPGAGAVNDTTTGQISPDRRRDKDTP